MSSTILVTGATGNIGRQLIQQLVHAGVPVRALVHTPEKAATIGGEGVDAVIGDFAQPTTLATALRGIERAYLIVNAPGNHTLLHTNFLDAAHHANVQQIVQLSMLGAESASPISFARAHWEMDQALINSAIPYTILRPNLFMQNFLQHRSTITTQGAFYMPMGNAQVSLIDNGDIAAVAARLLITGDYANQALVLTGGESITYAEVAAKISAVTGKSIRYVNVSFQDAHAGMLAAGLPSFYADDLVELYRLFSTGYGRTITEVVAKVTGREPHTFDHFVQEHIATFLAKEGTG